MRKKLNHLAKPENMYAFCGRLTPWLAIICAVLLVVGWIWGLGFAPTDYQQKDAFRIIYFHVPAAIESMFIYILIAIAGFIALVWQIKLAEWALVAMAPIGATFTFIALITGAIWGKPMWGTWWTWDARLTSELILLLLYVGVIGLYHAFDDRRFAGQAASLLALVGIVNIPIIHYSVTWWNTLHQSSTQFEHTIDPSMRTPLQLAIMGCLFFFLTLFCIRLRNTILINERRRTWVLDLVLGDKKA